MGNKQIITHSRLKMYRSCPEKHHMRYELGYGTVDDAVALVFGDVMHMSLASWFLARLDDLADGMPFDEPTTRSLNAALATWDAERGRLDPFDAFKLLAMLRGYDARWLHEPLYPLRVEQEFLVPVVNPETGAASQTFERAGKFDVDIEHRGDVHHDVYGEPGARWVMEHKSCGEDFSEGSAYERILRIDGQVSGYLDAANFEGRPCVGVLYDVLGKPKLRPLEANSRRATPETPEAYGQRCLDDIMKNLGDYYRRIPIIRFEHEAEQHRLDVWHDARRMRDDQVAGRHPRNPEACRMYNRMCEYFDVCTGAASLDDASKFTLLTNVHPELDLHPQAPIMGLDGNEPADTLTF